MRGAFSRNPRAAPPKMGHAAPSKPDAAPSMEMMLHPRLHVPRTFDPRFSHTSRACQNLKQIILRRNMSFFLFFNLTTKLPSAAYAPRALYATRRWDQTRARRRNEPHRSTRLGQTDVSTYRTPRSDVISHTNRRRPRPSVDHRFQRTLPLKQHHLSSR